MILCLPLNKKYAQHALNVALKGPQADARGAVLSEPATWCPHAMQKSFLRAQQPGPPSELHTRVMRYDPTACVGPGGRLLRQVQEHLKAQHLEAQPRPSKILQTSRLRSKTRLSPEITRFSIEKPIQLDVSYIPKQTAV